MEENFVLRNMTITANNFQLLDYSIFIITLSISGGIGVYFGCFGHAAKTTEEYLHGGHKMKPLPVAISLIASQLSGVTMMTVPSEMYYYGTQYFMMAPMMIFVTIAINYVFLPIFYENKWSNCFEYIECRFGVESKRIITFLYVLSSSLNLPVVMYIPSLAFAQTTGANIHLTNSVVCAIAVFYTVLGGIKAVVWTDVVQCGIMIGAVLLIGIYGTVAAGGLETVFSTASEGGRLIFFNTQLDMTTRTTFWNTCIGYSAIWLAYVGLNQSCAQRMVSLPSVKQAQKAMWLFCIGLIFITSFTCYSGLLIYHRYHGCDPATVNLVHKPDQLLPLYVQDVLGGLPGTSGIFISCIFSAGLSTLSAMMNALSAVIYKDWIKPLKFVNHTEARANFCMKSLVILLGVYCIFFEFLVAKFTNILDMVYSFSAFLNAPMFGIFCLGVFWPWANRKGAFVGLIVSVICMAYIIIGQLLMKLNGELVYPFLNTSIAECTNLGINTSQISLKIIQEPAPIEFSLTSISFIWFTVTGGIILFVVAVIISYLTGGNDLRTLNPSLLAPCIRGLLRVEQPQEMQLIQKKLIQNDERKMVEQVYST